MEPSPSPSTSHCGDVSINIYNTKALQLKEEDGVAPRTSSHRFFSFFFSSLSLLYLGSFPWPIKGKNGHPARGQFFRTLKPPDPGDLGVSFLQLTNDTSTPLHFHQRPGSSSLSRPFITPTIDLSASNTSSSPLDVGTFSLNKYTSSCSLCTPSKPKHTIIEIY
jgi:hypothetical protein